MKCVKSDSKEMFSHTSFLQLLEHLMPSNITEGAAKAYISRPCMSCWKILSEDREVLGFYTLEDVGDCICIGHAYVFQEHRKHSIRVLKHIIQHIEDKGLVPCTAVTSDYEYIVRVLKMLGLKVTGREVGIVKKPTGTFDLIHLTKQQ